MLPFLKKKVTPSEMGTALSVFLDGLLEASRTSDLELVAECAKDSRAVGRDQLENEVFYLYLFAVDTAVCMALGSRAEAILDAFFEHVRRAVMKNPRLYDEAVDRIEAYNAGIKSNRERAFPSPKYNLLTQYLKI